MTSGRLARGIVAGLLTQVAGVAAIAGPAIGAAQAGGTWTNLKTAPRAFPATAVMKDGTALVSGGMFYSPPKDPKARFYKELGKRFTKSASIFDPSAEKWKTAPPMLVRRAGHVTVPLRNGNVLAIGGYRPVGPHDKNRSLSEKEAIGKATDEERRRLEQLIIDFSSKPDDIHLGEVYSPKKARWMAVRDPRLLSVEVDPRGLPPANREALRKTGSNKVKVQPALGIHIRPLAVRLEGQPCRGSSQAEWCGRVLAVSGADPLNALFYDPPTSKWIEAPKPLPSLPQAIAVLNDGRALLLGRGATPAQVFDPEAGKWEAAPPPPISNDAGTPKWSSATTLSDGRVLLVGGALADVPTRSAQIYDPKGVDPAEPGKKGTWQLGAQLPQGRVLHSASLLPGGKVLVVGGEGFGLGDPASKREGPIVYDPSKNEWQIQEGLLRHLPKSAGAPLYTIDIQAAPISLAVLRDGRTLLVGNIFYLDLDDNQKLGKSAMLYTPPGTPDRAVETGSGGTTAPFRWLGPWNYAAAGGLIGGLIILTLVLRRRRSPG